MRIAKPKVSIVMPAFNRQDLIGASIASVQAQSLPDWELIIVDDGSTDETEAVAASYAANDARIITLRRTPPHPKGPSSCRNIGLTQAQGEYVIFLDSDDLLAAHCIEARIAAANASPAFHLYVFQMQFFFKQPGDTKELFFYADRQDVLGSTLIHGSPWGITCPMWKRSALLELGGFDPELPSWEDWDLHVRAFILGYTYKIYDDIDAYCRQGLLSLTAQHESLSHVQSRIDMYSKLGKLLRERKLDPKYLERLAGRCLSLCGQLNDFQRYSDSAKTWQCYYKEKILSKYQFTAGKVYLSFRKFVFKRNDSVSTKILRKVFSSITPSYLIWSY